MLPPRSIFVLIVEDDAGALRTLTHILKYYRYAVRPTDSVKAALIELNQIKPQIALVDLDLPDGTGEEVIRHIKERGFNTRIFLISAAAEIPEYVRQNAMILQKPLDIEGLLNAIRGERQ